MNFDFKKECRSSLNWLEGSTIFLTVHGSQCYGTSTPESDVDYKGVCVPPLYRFYQVGSEFEQHDQNDPDMVIYGLRKFLSLASSCNPNIIEVLHTDDEYLVLCNRVGQLLRESGSIFLSKQVRYSFGGYAKGQLARIKTHRSWLLSPPSHKPTRAEFGLPEDHKMSATEYGAMESLEQEGYVFPESLVTFVQKEKAYRNAVNHYQQYNSWKKSRNEKRAALEVKFSYDTKHGMHLVRLLRMCEEILRTGKVNVKRPDAKELLDIRAGAWSYEDLIEWSEKQEEKIKEAFETSSLRDKVDMELINSLSEDLHEMVHQE